MLDCSIVTWRFIFDAVLFSLTTFLLILIYYCFPLPFFLGGCDLCWILNAKLIAYNQFKQLHSWFCRWAKQWRQKKNVLDDWRVNWDCHLILFWTQFLLIMAGSSRLWFFFFFRINSCIDLLKETLHELSSLIGKHSLLLYHRKMLNWCRALTGSPPLEVLHLHCRLSHYHYINKILRQYLLFSCL